MTIEPFSLQTSALRPSDIAERLAVEPSTVYRWIKSGELPAIEIVGAKYVLIPAYERFLERRESGATIEEQAKRDIGPGFEEEYEGEFDPLEGLRLPIAQGSTPTGAPAGSPLPAIEDVRVQLRQQLDALEASFHIPSERVHRLYFVERRPDIKGGPDADILAQWASAYAAYMSLSLVPAR